MNIIKNEILSDYRVEVDCVNVNEWNQHLQMFGNANIYQTWEYDAIRCGDKNISHLVLKKNNEIVSLAQVRIQKIPVLNMGAAYVRWAPIWKKEKALNGMEIFGQTIRALRNEYVCNRKLILRIFPYLFDGIDDKFGEIMREEKYKWNKYLDRGRTLIMDIRRSSDDIRKGMAQKWRNCLNASERNGLEIISGTDDELFGQFDKIYEDMISRKGLKRASNIDEFRIIQRNQKEVFKVTIFICKYSGQACSGAICSAIGDTGIYLFGATNEIALKNRAAYLIQWHVIQWLKECGCAYYNLNGINPKDNPGTFKFKEGLSGKNGRDLNYMGFYEAYPTRIIERCFLIYGNLFSRIALAKKALSK
jgi:hypothetical protein